MLSENIELWKEEMRQEIRQQSRQQGLEQGVRETKEDLLFRLLKAKLGAVSKQALRRIEKASMEELDQWFDRLLSNEMVECLE